MHMHMIVHISLRPSWKHFVNTQKRNSLIQFLLNNPKVIKWKQRLIKIDSKTFTIFRCTNCHSRWGSWMRTGLTMLYIFGSLNFFPFKFKFNWLQFMFPLGGISVLIYFRSFFLIEYLLLVCLASIRCWGAAFLHCQIVCRFTLR